MQAHRDPGTIALLVLFLMIFCCNIPFIFFAGKLSVISIVQTLSTDPTGQEEEDVNFEFLGDDDNFQRVVNEGAIPDELSRAKTSTKVDLTPGNAPGSGLDAEVSAFPASQHATPQAGRDQPPSYPAAGNARSRVSSEAKPTTLQQSEAGGWFDDFSQSCSMGPKAQENELPEWLYYTVCLTYLAGVCLAAIVIEDLTLVFGIIAGVAECTTVFILPSVFYLQACKMEAARQLPHQDPAMEPLLAKKGKRANKRRGGSLLAKVGVTFFMLAGITYFCLSNYFFVVKVGRL